MPSLERIAESRMMIPSSGIFLLAVFGCFLGLALCQGADLSRLHPYMSQVAQKVTVKFRKGNFGSVKIP